MIGRCFFSGSRACAERSRPNARTADRTPCVPCQRPVGAWTRGEIVGPMPRGKVRFRQPGCSKMVLRQRVPRHPHETARLTTRLSLSRLGEPVGSGRGHGTSRDRSPSRLSRLVVTQSIILSRRYPPFPFAPLSKLDLFTHSRVHP